MTALALEAVGAVTPVGLNAPAACAAIRAGVSRVAEAWLRTPPEEPLCGARVRAGRSLRRTHRDWLINLTTQAMKECLADIDRAEPLGLFVAAPELERAHPAFDDTTADAWLADVAARLGVRAHPASRVFLGGAAALADCLDAAAALIGAGAVRRCVVGGVDSLFNQGDIARLVDAHRVHDDDNAQGLFPGEGAVFLRVAGWRRGAEALAVIAGVGSAEEADCALSERSSTGRPLLAATRRALAATGSINEPQVSWVVSNMNGERHAFLEAAIAHSLAYPSRRESLEVRYPARSTGDLGAASMALAVLVAAMAMRRGYAAGPVAMCEGASHGPRRGACVVVNLTLAAELRWS